MRCRERNSSGDGQYNCTYGQHYNGSLLGCCFFKSASNMPSITKSKFKTIVSGIITGVPIPAPPPPWVSNVTDPPSVMRSAVPLGGISCGAVELRGDGSLAEVSKWHPGRSAHSSLICYVVSVLVWISYESCHARRLIIKDRYYCFAVDNHEPKSRWLCQSPDVSRSLLRNAGGCSRTTGAADTPTYIWFDTCSCDDLPGVIPSIKTHAKHCCSR